VNAFPGDTVDYTVNLEVYSGPLDLLLYLVREHEVEVHDIPVAPITDQYIRYLETLRELDINVAAEFLVMASTLMEIKSKMLLPKHEREGEDDEDEELEDPRADLVRQLVEYKRYRDLAGLLSHQADERERMFCRGMEYWIEQESEGQDVLIEADAWSLVKAYASLLKQTLATTARRIVRDDTPIEVYADRVLHRIRTRGRAHFSDFTKSATTRGACAGLFLAVLELVKQRQVRVQQSEFFGPIEILPTEE
jgi:segregation and condensation protein A